jgi:IS5 family transposase
MSQARLDALLDPRHQLVRLAGVMDWSGLEEDLSPYYCLDDGRTGVPIRLMAGVILLKELSV